MNRGSFGVGVFAALALTACQTSGSARVETALAEQFAQLPEEWQTVSSQATQPQNWQTLFDDGQLSDYLSRAEASNLDFKEAQARLRQSEASLRQTRALLGPSVSADLGITGFAELADLGNTSDSASSTLSSSFDPDIFGVNRARVRAAEAQFQLQKANTERLRRVILAQTSRAYIQIIEADLQLLLAQENLSFLEETKRVSEARFDAGDIARSDLALAELEFENAVAGLRNQEFAARAARRALSVVIGDFGDDDLRVAMTLPAPAILGLSPVPADLLQARNDILSARVALALEIANLEVAEKANWPSLRLTGRISSTGAQLTDLFDPDFYLASLGASLGGVLFDSGRNAAEIDAANARLDAALLVYSDVLRTAVFEVNNSFDEIETLTRALAALERGRVSAEEALALEQIKFDLGETILLDVLTVQRRVNAIRGSRIATERRLLDAQISAYLALGG
ncbi:MAG: TolC family protein [Pseudomonadota bacterium]